MSLFQAFYERACAMEAPRVLELGTKRSLLDRSTMHCDFVPHAAEYLGTDIEPGVDVDIVADVHRLSQVVGRESFDIIISCSTFEHFKYPHLAAHEVLKSLRVGGLVFIQTHQSFPLHAFPYDYFRFSREALSGLFSTRMGFVLHGTDYEFPCSIVSEADPGGRDHPAWLNVRLFGEKVEPTPSEYIYEL
jgi:hypothetical protein